MHLTKAKQQALNILGKIHHEQYMMQQHGQRVCISQQNNSEDIWNEFKRRDNKDRLERFVLSVLALVALIFMYQGVKNIVTTTSALVCLGIIVGLTVLYLTQIRLVRPRVSDMPLQHILIAKEWCVRRHDLQILKSFTSVVNRLVHDQQCQVYQTSLAECVLFVTGPFYTKSSSLSGGVSIPQLASCSEA